MQWQDKGIVLSSKKYGEHSLIIRFLTEEHGVHSGLVKYGLSKKEHDETINGIKTQTYLRYFEF